MKQKAIFTLLLLLIAALSFAQADRSDTTKILFIGNSYTYFNSSPELLKGLAKEKFPDHVVETQLVSQGGMTLERHWKGDRALEALKSKDWDYVVLQDQSKLGMGTIIDDRTYFGETSLFFEYARRFDAEIKKTTAETVFFMTWSTENHPEEQEILTHAYSSMAKELGAKLAPVGLVWDAVRDQDQMNLYYSDGSHPSAYGSYLIATTMFATLFGESPVDLSGQLSGNQLSSTGAIALESATLTDISTSDANVIQAASWAVVESLNKSGHYPEVEKPSLNFPIPVLEAGESMDLQRISGRWYGTSTYSGDYDGLILDVKSQDNNPKVSLAFYTPDRADQMTIAKFSIEDDQLHLTIMDSLRSLRSKITFSMSEGQLTGVSKSLGSQMTRYKSWDISKNQTQNGIDLESVDVLMQSFRSNTEKSGYIAAALRYYTQYSELIGKAYKPEETYLNAMGNILINDNKSTEALNLFELATTLYPQSINAYLNYGEALLTAKQPEKGIRNYTAGYELAKSTNHKDVLLIEANLKKLKVDASAIQRVLPPPPPPPPPRGGH